MKYISNVFRVEMLYILKNAYLSTRVPYIFERLSAIDLFLLIRVYNPTFSALEIHSFIHNNIKNNNEISIIPFYNEYEYFSCYMNNTLKLFVPNDYNYYVQFVSFLLF